MTMSDVRIVPVTSRREVRDVVMFPFRLYRDDPNWVPPIIADRMKHFDPAANPFYDHAEVQLFRALRGDDTVGTIAAIADETHPRIWNEPVGFFGEFEVVQDVAVAHALFDAAREWLTARGREVMRGPMNMNVNEEIGLFVDGDDGPPVIMMTYNPPYYREYIEVYGFAKAKDLHAYKIDITQYAADLSNAPEQVVRVARVARERFGVTIRQLNVRHIHEDVALIKPIYRQAWQQNWGAVPITDEELDHLADSLVQIADARLTYLAFIDGQAVGVFVAVPDFCQVAIHLGGRLFPIGWLKYLWYKRKITGMRVLIMGVLEEHRLKGIESLFYYEALRQAKAMGMEWAELSWILEDNYKVRRGIELMGGRVYRTYRLYDIPTARPSPTAAAG